jgi:hypothetical protein
VFSTKWGTPIEPRNFNRSWDTRCRFLAVSSGFGDQVGVVLAWRVDEGVMVSLGA